MSPEAFERRRVRAKRNFKIWWADNKNKEGVRERKAAWKLANPERHTRAVRDSLYRRKYGITIDDYERMFEAQQGCCKICGKPEAKLNKNTGQPEWLSVDHDKLTKKIGGLLCTKHNKAIGGLDHNIEYLESAITYLKERNLASQTV